MQYYYLYRRQYYSFKESFGETLMAEIDILSTTDDESYVVTNFMPDSGI